MKVSLNYVGGLYDCQAISKCNKNVNYIALPASGEVCIINVNRIVISVQIGHDVYYQSDFD